MKKICKASFIALLCCIIILPLFLVLSCTIPHQAIEKNTTQSMDILYQEGMHPRFFLNSSGCMMDNFTDMIILSEAMCVDEKKPVVSAMRSTMVGFGDELFADNYRAFVQKEPVSFYRDYSWYWHGYLVAVRPLLVFTDFVGIRVINSVLMFGLALLIFILAWKKLSIRAAIGFLLALIASFFIVVPLSVQYGSVFLIALICSLLILTWDKVRTLPGGSALFIIAGSMAAFLDLLTAPLVSFGIPAMFYLMFAKKNQKEDAHFLCGINRLFAIGISWCIGFAVMWCWKWLLGSLILGENIIAAAMDEAAFMSVNKEETSLMQCLLMVSSFITSLVSLPPIGHTILRLALVLLGGIGFLIYLLGFRSKAALIENIPYLLVALIPFAWCIVFLNHVTIHIWFVFRIFSLTAFGGTLFIAGTFSAEKCRQRLFRHKQ